MLAPKIIFENQDFLVLDKPSGWIVNNAQTTKNQPTIQSWLAKNIKSDIHTSADFRSGIVHRLDKETSGVLLIAKTPKSFANLQKQFKERTVKKEYTALVHGLIEPNRGEVKVPVGRLPWNRERFGVLPGGRPSETSYEAIGKYQKEKENYTLLKLKPITGRTHQIRIHMNHLKHPLVADTFYAGRKRAKQDRRWCPRLFLHASKITIQDPVSTKRCSFESDLPPDLTSALYTLQTLT